MQTQGDTPKRSPLRIVQTSGHMRWLILAGVVFLSLMMASGFKSDVARAEPGCTDGTQESGALYRICMPVSWNGILFVYARGAIYPQNSLYIQDPVLIPGPPEITLSQLLNSQGFAFATSSYRRSGLAILEGVDDLQELVQIFTNDVGTPSHVVIGGFSEGGYVSTLSSSDTQRSTMVASRAAPDSTCGKGSITPATSGLSLIITSRT